MFRRNTTLPVVLDVGTNNHHWSTIRSISVLGQPRVRGGEYFAFVDEFVEAVQQLYPKCCIQWEDFANFNAVPILDEYENVLCTFNDDIQGTAAAALAGILGALGSPGRSSWTSVFCFSAPVQPPLASPS